MNKDAKEESKEKQSIEENSGPITTVNYTVVDANKMALTQNYADAEKAMTDALELSEAFARMKGAHRPKFPFKLYKATTITTTTVELEKEFES